MWAYLAAVEASEGGPGLARRLGRGSRTDFWEWARSERGYAGVLERAGRRAPAPRAARAGDGCDLQENEARSERRGGFLLQDGLCALCWLRTCTQPQSWRTVKLRFAISGGAADSNDRGLKLVLPADQAGDQPS